MEGLPDITKLVEVLLVNRRSKQSEDGRKSTVLEPHKRPQLFKDGNGILRIATFRENMRSIEERGQDYTILTHVNSSIAEMKGQKMCSDCFKQETKSLFKKLNCDKKDFL